MKNTIPNGSLTSFGGMNHQTFQTVVRALKVASLAVVAGTLALTGNASAADTVLTFKNGQTDLTIPTNYFTLVPATGGFETTNTSTLGPTFDVLFGGTTNNTNNPTTAIFLGGRVDPNSIPNYNPAILTANGSGAIGSINDTDVGQITVTSTRTAPATITIGGGSDAANGTNPANLIYVSGISNLTFTPFTAPGTAANPLSLTLLTTGNIDSNGTLAIGTNVTLTAATTLTFTGTGATTLSGGISETAPSANVAVTEGPGGSVTFGAANSYTGTTVINSGVLDITNNSALGTALASTSGVTVTGTGAALQIQNSITTTTAVPLTLNGTGVGSNGALENVSGTNTYTGLITLGSSNSNTYIGSDAGTLTLSGGINETANNNALTFVGAGNVTVSSDITGTGGGGPPYSVTKFGTGTLLLTGTNDFTGDIAVDAGILQIGNGTTGSLTSGTPLLAMGGGTFIFGGNGAGSLTVNGLDVGINTPGASEVSVPNTGQVLNLGAILRNNGSTVDFTLPTGTQSATNGITTSTGNDPRGIFGGYATVGGTSWATNSAGNIIALANGSYVTTTTAGNTAATYAAANIDVTSSQTPGALITPNTLRFNDTGTSANASETLTLQGANVITDGGILVTTGVGTGTSTITGVNGSSITTFGGIQLSVIQNNPTGSLIISTQITGAESLVVSGTGQVDLFGSVVGGLNTGSNNYSGNTFLNGNQTGSQTIEIGESATALANAGGAITPFGTGGTVNVNAPTTLTTDGNNTAGGATAYSVADQFSLSGTLTVNVPTAGAGLTLSGSITPGSGTSITAATSGLVVNSGAGDTGTLTLSGGNTYTGGTIIDGGTLTGTGASPLGDPTGSLQVNGSVGGTVLNLTTTGTTTIGSLSGTATALAPATINTGGAIFFFGVNQTVAGTYAGTIAGAGSLLMGGTAPLSLTGANSYAGGTTINAGAVLAAGNASALGSGAVTNNGMLESTAASLSTGVAQTINVGTPGVPVPLVVSNYTQNSASTLLLQVVSNEGVRVQTQASAGLGGNYDTLAATGTASFAGGQGGAASTILLNFQAGAPALAGQRFQVASSVAGPVTSTNTTYPTAVTTTGNINPYIIPITSYNDNFNGTFANNNIVVTLFQPLTTFTAQGLTPNQQSVANNLDNIANALFNPNSPYAVTTANGVIYTPLAAGSLNKDFFDNILEGVSLAAGAGYAGQALDELSPQRFEVLRNVAFDNYAFDIQSLDQEFARERMGFGGVDTAGFTFNNSELGPELSQVRSRLLAWSPAQEPGLLSDSSQTVLGGTEMITTSPGKSEMAPVLPENPWNVFIDGGADLGDQKHNVDVSRSTYTTGRVRLGADYRVTTNLRVGALFGYGHTDADLDNEGSKAHVDSYTPGVFLTYADKEGFYANGLFTYTANEYKTDRDIIIPGVNRTANGSFGGNQFGGDLDGGYDFHRGDWTFGPSLGLTYVNLGMDSFTESGAQAADLVVNRQSADSLRSRLGGTASYRTEIGSVVVTPYISAYWQHEFLDHSSNITSAFTGLPGGTFAVQTISGDSDNALLGVGLNAELNETVTLFIDYGAEAGGSTFFGQSATGGVKLGF